MNSEELVNLKKGWFLHCVHDLIGGLTIYGVFETELKATDFSKNISGYDEKNILFLYYVEFDGKIFALGQMSECIGVDYRND